MASRLRLELSRLVVKRTTGSGAQRLPPSAPADVGLPRQQRSFSFVGGNA
jgi:hypothetical protein